MKYNKLYIVAALLGVMFTACQKEQAIEKPEQPEEPQTWTLKIEVPSNLDTKALTFDGSTLTHAFAENEKVDVFYGSTCLGTLSAGAPAAGKVTLSGNIAKNAEVTAGKTLTLLYPGRNDHAWTYLGQDGSAPDAAGTMATGYDYSKATITVDAVTASTLTGTVSSAFARQQSVYRFGFKVGGAGDAIAVSSFTVSSSQNKLVRSMAYSGSEWAKESYGSITVTPVSDPAENLYYMSLRNENTTVADTYSFMIVRKSDSALLEGTKAISDPANLEIGKFLSMKSIEVNSKAFAPVDPAVATISLESQVL